MRRILVADDLEESRLLLRTLLGSQDYEVEAVGNGAEALAAAHRRRPDLLITDILMPVMDGFALCRAWRADVMLRDIPVVFYTATYTDPRDEEFALSLGAARFLIKPADPDVFLDMLGEVLAEHGRALLEPAEQAPPEESVFLREYNEALIRKLEQRVEAQRRSEALLRVSEAAFRTLFDDAPYGILRCDRLGRILSCNPALLEILSQAAVPGTLADFAEDATACSALLDAIARGEGVTGLEMAWKRHDGSLITVKVVGRMVEETPGGGDVVHLFVENLTDRRKLESQLRQSQKMEAIGRLTGGIAHDFNNILTVIAANAEFLTAAVPAENEEARRDLEDLRAAASRGAAMVKKLMGFSRKETLEFTSVDLGRHLQDLSGMLRRLVPEHITVDISTAPGGRSVSADRNAIDQILFNLVTNARDAMPEGGQLTLAVDHLELEHGYHRAHPWVAPGPFVRVTVTDTGVGMDAQTRDRMFEPFFTTKAPGQGTGLGLAMVYGLMEQHGGFVSAYSEPGQGTELQLYFPVTTETGHVSLLPDTEATAGRGAETILIVEDEEAIRRAARRALEGSGYRVLTASDGEEALELLSAHPEVALVLSDLVMPRLGGRQLLEAVRAGGRRTPFLFMSGYAAPVSGRGDESEETPVLRKPWVLSELRARVRESLEHA